MHTQICTILILFDLIKELTEFEGTCKSTVWQIDMFYSDRDLFLPLISLCSLQPLFLFCDCRRFLTRNGNRSRSTCYQNKKELGGQMRRLEWEAKREWWSQEWQILALVCTVLFTAAHLNHLESNNVPWSLTMGQSNYSRIIWAAPGSSSVRLELSTA